MVSQFSGLVMDACSLLLMQNNDSDADASQALQILELGRGAISNLLIDDRTDISHLRARYPETAARFERPRVQLNMPASDAEAQKSPYPASQTTIVKELHHCIDNSMRRDIVHTYKIVEAAMHFICQEPCTEVGVCTNLVPSLVPVYVP